MKHIRQFLYFCWHGRLPCEHKWYVRTHYYDFEYGFDKDILSLCGVRNLQGEPVRLKMVCHHCKAAKLVNGFQMAGSEKLIIYLE